MEKIKCLECGSGNIAKKDEFYICENCKTMYRIEGMKSTLERDNVSSENNNDLFKSSHYKKTNHSPQISVDVYLLQNPSDDDVRYVIDSLVEKTKLVLWDVSDIKNKDSILKAQTDAFEDFNTSCYVICEELVKNKHYELINYFIFTHFDSAYHIVYDCIREMYDYDNWNDKVGNMFLYFRILNNEFSDKIHRLEYDIRQGKYAETAYITHRNIEISFTHIKILYSWLTEMFHKIKAQMALSILLGIATLVFLFMTILSISNGKPFIYDILLLILLTIACLFGFLFCSEEDKHPILLFLTVLFWITNIFFILFDFGFGLNLFLRIVFGGILIGVSLCFWL